MHLRMYRVGAQPTSLHRPQTLPTLQSLCRRRPTALALAARGRGGNRGPLSEADLYVAVDPASSASSSSSEASQPAPWFVVGPAGFAALVAVARAVKAMTRGKDRSLEERGYKRGGVADENYYSKVMKGMRTVSYDELSDEQVEAARQRRRQEIARDAAPMNLEDVELPENHPFAVRKPVSKEEEELQRMRLSARRGLSSEDMRLLKQQQALADQMEIDEEERRQRRSR